MSSQQGLRQASVRAVTGTTLSYDGDWAALFTAAGIAAGNWNGRLLQWINIKLGTAYTGVVTAMAAFATNQNATNFSAIGTFDATTSSQAGKPIGLLLVLTKAS